MVCDVVAADHAAVAADAEAAQAAHHTPTLDFAGSSHTELHLQQLAVATVRDNALN